VYGKALALVAANEPASAIPTFTRLRDAHPEVLPFHTALGQAQLAAARPGQRSRRSSGPTGLRHATCR